MSWELGQSARDPYQSYTPFFYCFFVTSWKSRRGFPDWTERGGGAGRSLWTTWWTALSVLFWRLWVYVISQPFMILVHSRAKGPMPYILMIWIRLVGWFWKSELSLFGVKLWFGCRWYWDIAWCWGIRILCFKRTRILWFGKSCFTLLPRGLRKLACQLALL